VRRAGFIVNSRVPEPASFRKGMPPHALLTGWDDAGSPMSFMRFRAISRHLQGTGWHYELYRPWRRYDVVVFLKSMGAHCMALARRLRERGSRVVFEANVDYYTRPEGTVRLDAMAPTDHQRSDAEAITRFADLVIASSRHLAEVCRAFNPHVEWVPDNVEMAQLPRSVDEPTPVESGRLNVWWSGMESKVFEFLAAEDAFLVCADRIHLHLVTGDIESGRRRWPADIAERTDDFLRRVPHTIHRFRDIPDLLARYSNGGVIVSPRFLDTPYNLSHTEWKITLGMAAGLPVIASPVPSYRDVSERAEAGAVTLCDSLPEWTDALLSAVNDPAGVVRSGAAAKRCVETHYSTSVVARMHSKCLDSLVR
jgi:Glycosyltransferase